MAHTADCLTCVLECKHLIAALQVKKAIGKYLKQRPKNLWQRLPPLDKTFSQGNPDKMKNVCPQSTV